VLYGGFVSLLFLVAVGLWFHRPTSGGEIGRPGRPFDGT
jgi:hypothetical protein